MKKLGIAVLSLVLAAPIGTAMADPAGKNKGKGHERSAAFDDGACQVERKWGKKGDYKEKMDCRGARPSGFGGYGSSTYPRYRSGYGGPPAYLYEPPPPAYWYGYR